MSNDGYQVFAGDTHISVVWQGDSYRERGTAEADWFPFNGDEGHWHIARVLVQPETVRGRGIGKTLLAKLKEAVLGRGGTYLSVDPGGYNQSEEAQRAFYRACGFEATDDECRMLCHL